MIYWFFLFLAIVSEVIGTLSMKYASETGHISGHVVMYVMITLSYILLSLSVKRVALGVAYALWEGVGVVLITLFSALIFDEAISPMKALGLGTLLLGIMLIKQGTRVAKTQGNKRESNHAAA
ncbi:spermidine export protein MdtJ [Leminorella grimontii]|uniref:Spermidine export protein MdtJ n=1 Tax=Leminorella grimontii TaxID=82981 RepID=A0AAV5MZU7_9GAMM|nr:multidrug/spermidine efflux SMR transporter subunit MdtJ [Leminorella grimontii]KFC96003.1 MdtJ family spermidine export protein [Leminorella grimontii ATCC 33999 = DSM 5078]GKX54815.1 spermidine export protein MdtJ [Leminorella grimontii]VFS58412.1 Spermidine export protein MdtJ [Leminorella grimontii]